MYALLALLIVVLAGIGLLLNQSTGIASRTSDQSKVLIELRAAESARACQAKTDKMAFAEILDLLADNFSTAPYPDPDRQAAVQGMRDAATLFRDSPAPTCA